VRVWRIYDPEAAYALLPNFDPLDGQGAALYPGRWNKAGVRMVYTSQSPELAMLELLTKLSPAAFGVRLAVEIDVPDDARVQDAAPAVLGHLLRGEESDTQTYGSGWAARGQSLVLRVPSAVLPVSSNYLLNPLHPQAKRLRVVRQVEVGMDPRLVQSLSNQRRIR
jgi:RES domain-containing protein